MSNIVGTVISVKGFFSKKDIRLNVAIGEGPNKEFALNANRKYIIPRYQRELRWEENNLLQLINDISKGSKFLGNIILDNKAENIFEVVDGQQRMTMIYLIIKYIKKQHGERIETFESCPFNIETFKELDLLIDKDFVYENLSQDEQDKVKQSDELCQKEKYKKIWEKICVQEVFNERAKASSFINNLKSSELNIIINGEGDTGIHYFLDVNMKGVQLDTEDKFKGYLFMLDSSDEVKTLWSNLKKAYEKISINCKSDYGLMKIIEQYLFCEIYKNEEHANLSFGEDFKLPSGEHLIDALHDNVFMKKALKDLIKYLAFVNEVISVDGVSRSFQAYYNEEANLDNTNYKVYHNILKKVLLDSDSVPKALIMKYFLEVLITPEGKAKEDYEFIFTIYTLAFLFTIFETRKGNSKIYNTVRQNDWKNQCISLIKNYFDAADFTERKLTSQYRALGDAEAVNYEYRAKTLATIFNFMLVSEGNVKVKSGKYGELAEFLTNSNKYTVEHFLVNKSGKIRVSLVSGKTVNCKYPTAIKKFRNSLFNFIFISEHSNNEIENCSLKEKIQILRNDETKIECAYSKVYLQKIQTKFDQIPALDACTTKAEAQDQINTYFNQTFIDEYVELMKEMFNTFAASFK